MLYSLLAISRFFTSWLLKNSSDFSIAFTLGYVLVKDIANQEMFGRWQGRIYDFLEGWGIQVDQIE